MKILAIAIALATVVPSPLQARTLHPRHTAASINHIHGQTAVRKPSIFLLEDRGLGNVKSVPNSQDNFAIDY